MITENSTKKTQARAFSYFAFSGNLGIFIGSILGMYNICLFLFKIQTNMDPGGGLESPSKKFPSTFGRIAFFRDYPYALPGFIVALVALTAAILATFFIKEVCVLS